MERFKGLINLLDWRSGSMMGLYSLVMLFLIVYVVMVGKDIPSGVVTVYLGVLSAFTGSKTLLKWKNGEKSFDDNIPDSVKKLPG